MIRVHERDVTVHERGHAQEWIVTVRGARGRVKCESGVPWSWSVTINFAGQTYRPNG